MISLNSITGLLKISVITSVIALTGCGKMISIDVRGEGDISASSGPSCKDGLIPDTGDETSLFNAFFGIAVGGPACTFPVDLFSYPTYTAEPKEGFVFYGWENDCSGTDTCKARGLGGNNITAFFYPEAVAAALDDLELEDPWVNNCIADAMIKEETTNVDELETLDCWIGHPLAGSVEFNVRELRDVGNVSKLGLYPGSQLSRGFSQLLRGSNGADESTGVTVNLINEMDLVHLVSVSDLTLFNVMLEDPSLLVYLPLERLSITGTGLTSLDFLSNSVLLKELGLQNQPGVMNAENMAILQSLENLEILALQLNGLTSLDDVVLVDQIAELNLHGNLIEDLSPLDTLDNLTVVHLNNMELTSLSELPDLNGIEEITLAGNENLEYSAIGDLDVSTLKSLKIYNSDLDDEDFAFITSVNYPALEELVAYSNDFTDLSAMNATNFPALKSLDIRWGDVETLAPLSELPALETLEISASSSARETICAEVTALQAEAPNLVINSYPSCAED